MVQIKFFDGDSWEEFFKNLLSVLLSFPTFFISIPFIVFPGYILNYMIFRAHTKFAKEDSYIPDSRMFNLAMGFIPGSLVLIVYSLIVNHSFPNTIEIVSNSILPSSVILSSVTFIVFVWRMRNG